MVKVLFLCTGNSCRSQMAEGLLRWVGGSVVEAFSAGTHPQAVNPFAIRVLAEIGIDISTQRSKSVDAFLGKSFDYVITLCDSAREACPIFPGAARQLHWSLADPALAAGSDEERMRFFRSIRDEIAAHIDRLLTEIMERFLAKLAEISDFADAAPADV